MQLRRLALQVLDMMSVTLLLACGDDAGSGEPFVREGEQRAALDAGHLHDASADSGAQDAAAESAADSDMSTVDRTPKDAGQPEQRDAGARKPEAKPDQNEAPEPAAKKVAIRFQARIGKTDFACGQKYPSQGTLNTTVAPSDLRFFVHGVQLIEKDGDHVPVSLNERAPWQSSELALLDFEDGTGRCSDGTVETNTTLTGTVAPGEYRGIRFDIGVPSAQNHGAAANAQEPLKSARGLGAGGVEGYRFAKIAVTQLTAAGEAAGSALLELSSTQCQAEADDEVTCSKPNRSTVTFEAFDTATQTIVVDLAALWSQLDLTQAHACHSTEKSCEAMFNAVGVDIVSGEPKPGQTLFRVQ